MEVTVKQRLVEYLKFKGIGQNRFEKAAGISNGYISNLKGNIGTTILTKILNTAEDLNRDWLLTGEGNMLKEEKKPVQEAVLLKNPMVISVPLVSQYAYAGYLSGFADEEYIDTLPVVPSGVCGL